MTSLDCCTTPFRCVLAVKTIAIYVNGDTSAIQDSVGAVVRVNCSTGCGWLPFDVAMRAQGAVDDCND